MELISENKFTKVFKTEDDVEIFVSKAVDEDSNMHFIMCMIKEIPALKIGGIKQPYGYSTEAQRDVAFNTFGVDVAQGFYDSLVDFVTKQNDKLKEENEQDGKLITHCF